MDQGSQNIKNSFSRNPFLQKLPPPANQFVRDPLRSLVSLLQGGSTSPASTSPNPSTINQPKPILPMQNPWKLAEDTGNVFTSGRTPLQQKAKGGIDWGDLFQQFQDPHWGAMFQNDLLDQILDAQQMLSPTRAPLSHEPTMRQQFGEPVVDNYSRVRVPESRIPIDWLIREVVPRWGEPDERPRPGGAPSGLYDFPVVG